MADKKQKVLLKRSSTAGKMPNQITGSTVENGELFMNIATGTNATNFLTTLKAGGNSGLTEDYIKWSDDKYNEKKYSPITHNHDDRYYTETEIDGKLIKKSDTGHTHSATAITSGTLDIARIPTGTGSKQVALGNHDHDDVYATIKDVEDNELITSTAINKIIESVGLNEDCSTQFDDGESLTSAINKKVNITDRINSAYTAYSAITSVSATSATTADSANKVVNKLTIGNKTFDGSSAISIDASDLGLSSALKYCGKTTSVLSGIGATTNPIMINGKSHTATTGCVVTTDANKEYAWDGSKWIELGDESSFKVKQTAKTDPTASGSGLTFIATITQDTNGVITATKKSVDLSNYSLTGHTHDYAASSHVKASATTSAMGHVKLASGELSGKTSAVNGEAAASYHKHSNYQPKGDYAAGSHVNASATTSAMGHVKLVSGNVSGKTYKDGEAAAASHNHDNIYQPKGSYLTSETYKGTITGVTAGNGLTGGGSISTGSAGYTLHVGSGTGIAVGANDVSISTEYQNKIASGVSAYTISTALSGALEDVEFVIANALTTINASAGFNEDGTSTLDGGESLTSAINKKVNITDRINSAYTAYSATTVPFTGIPTGTTSSTVAVGNHSHSNYSTTSHTHSATAITGGTLNIARIPTGTGSRQVALGNHTHSDYATISNLEDVEFVISNTINEINKSCGLDENCASPFGISLSDKIEKHTHVADNITGGTLNIARIPTGTGSRQVALGNHTHTRTISSGTGTYYLLGWTSKTANTSTNSMKFYTSSTNVYMQNGNLYAASDERLKNFAGDVDVDLDDIKKIPKKYYTWKDDANKTIQIGTSAQKLQEIYPELVSENEDGKLAVSYDKLTMVALGAIDKLYDMINELKNENNILKDEIEKLKNK